MRNLFTSLTIACFILWANTLTAQTVTAGDVPSYSLDKAFNAMGATKAEDFRGKPILVDFWGTR
jgi:hypothetical protein